MTKISNERSDKMANNPYQNAEGYSDPTAFYGMRNVVKEEHEIEKTVHDMVHIIRDLSDILGFEIIGRIHFKHKKTGKEFK